MDLKEFLLDVFPNKDEEKYTKMINNLKRLGFDSVSDLKYLDEEAIKELDSFHRSDIEKLTDYLAKCEFETQDDVFYEIFAGIPLDRIKEIKIFLNKHEVYARSDVLLININEMKAKEFFSESELMRIESFLGKNYKEQFLKKKEAMELEKSKDLRHVLNEIFFGTPANRLEKIGGILKEEKIYSGKDVLIADLNSLHLKESLSSAEMLKFEEYLKKKNVVHYEKLMSDRELEKSKNLKCVLKQIFVHTPEDRLEEIENTLKEEQIYLGSHMEIVDTNDLRGKNSLSDIELLKIEEFIKKKNREGYDDIIKMAENERTFTRLKVEEKIQLYALKGEEELKIMQLKAQEEQKMIEFKTEGEKLLREEENMLKKAKAKEEMERENMKMQREKELMEARMKNEMEIEKIKMQREKELREEKAKDIEREKELREAKAKEEMERENMKMQREKELMEARMKKSQELKRKINKTQREKEIMEAKEEIEREKIEKRMQNDLIMKRCQSLINEKEDLFEDVRKLEKDCIRLKNVITENSQTAFKGFFTNSSLKKSKAEDEYEEMKKYLKSKNDRLTEIDQLLRVPKAV